jgi:hypothetical protein
MIATVATSPGLQPGVLNLTVASGLQIINSTSMIALGPQPRLFWLSSAAAAPAQAGTPVTIAVGNSPVTLSPANTAVFVNDIRAGGVAVNGSQITFIIPPVVPAGPALVRVEANGERSLNTVIPVEAASSSIRIVSAIAGNNLGVPVVLADVQNLGDKAVTATTNGKDAKVVQVWREADRYRVLIELPEVIPPGVRVTVVLSSDGRTSDPFSLTIGG